MTQPSETPPTPPPLPPHLEPFRAALAPQFAIERALGVGGMGTVLLARDLALDRPVAIKVVSPQVVLTTEVRERFLREARTVARLRHPNIVAVHSAGEAAGMLYFVMEYVEGESLRERLARGGPLPPEAVSRLLRELADALAHAHAAGIVHRDIKPENVLLERSTGTARLTDFGVARAFTETADERLTGTGMAIGTPRYMSPEQATGEREIDGRSDIYSLGLLGYEALSGAPAFVGSGPSVLVKQITERPEPVATRVPGTPRALAVTIDRALEKDPAARWQSATALREALEGGAAGAMTSARARPRRRLMPLAIAAVLLALAVAGFAWLGMRDGSADDDAQRRTLLVLPFHNMTGSPELDWLREGSASMLTLDMSQWRDLSVIGFERTLDLVRGAELASDRQIGLGDARDMAREANAGRIVMGDFQRRGDSLIVTARLYDVGDDQPVEIADARGSLSADPRALFDEVSRELLGADATSAFAARPGIAAQTTSSIEAFRHYVEGVTRLASWQLNAADSAFARAIAIDSTFALAYYKRSIGRGWRSESADSLKLLYAREALKHAGNLQERERRLIAAYATFSEQQYQSARAQYDSLVRRDSLDAEAWYGLADAAYHSFDFNTALHAFQRSLQLDPTLHLAYAHEVELFTDAAEPRRNFVLRGDSIVYFGSSEQYAALGSADSVASLRRSAARRAVETARQWVRADPRSSYARFALANALIAARQSDEAERTLAAAMNDPATSEAAMRFRIAAVRLRAGRVDALAAVKTALDSASIDSLRNQFNQHSAEAFFSSLSAAAYGGSPSTLMRTSDLLERVFPVVPLGGRSVPMRQLSHPLSAMLRLAMGDDSPESRRLTDASIAMIDGAPEDVRANLRQQASSVPYLAYLVFRDDRYRQLYEEWLNGSPSPTLRAIAAVARGDTAAARRAADSLPGPELVATPMESPVRAIGSAAVFIELGDLERALPFLERLDPDYFDVDGPDARWAFYPRSFFVRGTLYERLGRRDEAIAAYRRFLELWANADPSMSEQVRAARASIARLGEAPR